MDSLNEVSGWVVFNVLALAVVDVGDDFADKSGYGKQRSDILMLYPCFGPGDLNISSVIISVIFLAGAFLKDSLRRKSPSIPDKRGGDESRARVDGAVVGLCFSDLGLGRRRFGTF